MMKPATSVIIPCYNGEKYLPEALESIRKQTVPVREILLVDDGSAVPLQAPSDWDGPPLHIIRTPNRGLAVARNLGLRHAAGEFVAFLDSDDFWHPRKVEGQETALRANPTAVACYTRCVQAPGFYGFGPYPPADVSEDDFLLILWSSQFFPPSSVMARRETIEAVGPFGEHYGNGEDVELWMRLLTLGHFVQVPEPLTFYRQHAGQFTTNIYRRLAGGKRARASIIAQHGDRLIRAGLRRDQLWDAYRTEILLVFYRRHFGPARRLLWDYWKDHPLDGGILLRALVSLLPSGLVTRLRGRLPEGPPPAPRDALDEGPESAWSRHIRNTYPDLGRNRCNDVSLSGTGMGSNGRCS